MLKQKLQYVASVQEYTYTCLVDAIDILYQFIRQDFPVARNKWRILNRGNNCFRQQTKKVEN